MTIIDAHTHLNGSVSLEFLRETAIRNKCLASYDAFMQESDVWKKFGHIHAIIQTHEDITLAAIDVVESSTADRLEIRTTPKGSTQAERQTYIDAFVSGLKQAQEKYPDKTARGLLSIDRSRHSLVEAKEIIDAAVKEKQKHDLIVGIDLSGNFLAPRHLTGSNLEEAIQYALSKDIGLALHVGEVDSREEREDFDIILKAISAYPGKIYGKVRLGHAIYRTAEQDAIIKRLKVPIEICPTCHRKLGWSDDDSHPILSLYQFRKRVLPGTDDSALFDCDAKGEQEKLDNLLKPSDKDKDLSEAEQTSKLDQKRLRYLF